MVVDCRALDTYVSRHSYMVLIFVDYSKLSVNTINYDLTELFILIINDLHRET